MAVVRNAAVNVGVKHPFKFLLSVLLGRIAQW